MESALDLVFDYGNEFIIGKDMKVHTVNWWFKE